VTVGHSVGKRFLSQHEGVEQTLIEKYELPDGAHSISVSLDRISMPMEEPRSRPKGRPRKGAPKESVLRRVSNGVLRDRDDSRLEGPAYSITSERARMTGMEGRIVDRVLCKLSDRALDYLFPYSPQSLLAPDQPDQSHQHEHSFHDRALYRTA
jgi:hypothetical protein